MKPQDTQAMLDHCNLVVPQWYLSWNSKRGGIDAHPRRLMVVTTPNNIPALGYSWDSEKLERTISIGGKVIERKVITRKDS